jgi:hypothetical protein
MHRASTHAVPGAHSAGPVHEAPARAFPTATHAAPRPLAKGTQARRAALLALASESEASTVIAAPASVAGVVPDASYTLPPSVDDASAGAAASARHALPSSGLHAKTSPHAVR